MVWVKLGDRIYALPRQEKALRQVLPPTEDTDKLLRSLYRLADYGHWEVQKTKKGWRAVSRDGRRVYLYSYLSYAPVASVPQDWRG